MPYQAEQDTTIPRVIGHRVIPGTNERVAIKESVNYPTGAVVFEKDMTPEVLRSLDEGDDHLSSLLRYIDVAEAQRILGRQIQVAAATPIPESEILHQEERFGGGGPTVDPEVEVGDSPPYEAPPVSGETAEIDPSNVEGSQEVETSDQTVAEAADEPLEPVPPNPIEENAAGSADSTGDSSDEVVEEMTETVEDAPTEDQPDGRDQTTEVQEATGDKYDSMDLDALKAEAKDRKITGRTKLKTEDALREALRKADTE